MPLQDHRGALEEHLLEERKRPFSGGGRGSPGFTVMAFCEGRLASGTPAWLVGCHTLSLAGLAGGGGELGRTFPESVVFEKSLAWSVCNPSWGRGEPVRVGFLVSVGQYEGFRQKKMFWGSIFARRPSRQPCTALTRRSDMTANNIGL